MHICTTTVTYKLKLGTQMVDYLYRHALCNSVENMSES